MKNTRKMIPGIALIVLGTIFILRNYFDIYILEVIEFDKIWPFIALISGVYLVFIKISKK